MSDKILSVSAPVYWARRCVSTAATSGWPLRWNSWHPMCALSPFARKWRSACPRRARRCAGEAGAAVAGDALQQRRRRGSDRGDARLLRAARGGLAASVRLYRLRQVTELRPERVRVYSETARTRVKRRRSVYRRTAAPDAVAAGGRGWTIAGRGTAGKLH